MKISRKTNLLLTAFLLFLVLVPQVGWYDRQIQVAYANPDPGWLSSWSYRRSHIITNATGLGSNYNVSVTVYYNSSNFPLASFTYLSRWESNAKQGVASDGTYIYTSNSTTICKYDKSGNLQTNQDDAHLDGTDMTQVNSILYYDGKLYIGSNNYENSPRRGYIKVFNASDLSYIEEHQVLDYWCEGCDFHDNAWWVVFCEKKVAKYDNNWTHIATYNLTTDASGAYNTLWHQSIRWRGDCIYANLHEGCSPMGVEVYRWNGSGFDYVDSLTTPTSKCTQGLSFEPNNATIMWFAERNYPGVGTHQVVKSSIGEDCINLNEKCRADFGDIRFTDDDGVTELDYWLMSKTDSSNATFWVTIQDDLSSVDRTIYLYYGRSDVTSTSTDFREDFTTYTEVDISPDRIQKTSYHTDHLAYRNETTYLYKDMGTNHFMNFEHYIKMKTDYADDYGFGAVWMLSDVLNDMRSLFLASEPYISIHVWCGPSTKQLSIEESYGGARYHSHWEEPNANTWYYLVVKKDGTDLSCKIYSNQQRTKLLKTLNLTLHSEYSFRYIYACNTYDDGHTYYLNNDIEDFFIRKAVFTEPKHSIWGDEEARLSLTVKACRYDNETPLTPISATYVGLTNSSGTYYQQVNSTSYAKFTGLSGSITYFALWENTTNTNGKVYEKTLTMSSDMSKKAKCEVWDLSITALYENGEPLPDDECNIYWTAPNGTQAIFQDDHQITFDVCNGTAYHRTMYLNSWVSENSSITLDNGSPTTLDLLTTVSEEETTTGGPEPPTPEEVRTFITIIIAVIFLSGALYVFRPRKETDAEAKRRKMRRLTRMSKRKWKWDMRNS